MASESGPTVSSEQLDRAEQYRQRRATAVLCPVFGDIEDSTRLLEELGEVEYDELRQSHNHSIRAVIERDAEGAVVQTYGDGFLAVFSEPSTAVERCLEIQQLLKRHRFRLRIGIDMGQVALKRASGIVSDVFGRHVNRASRIESQAMPGSVLTSFPVYDSSVGWLRSSVRWTHHSPLQLKGFADPISLHEPVLLSAERAVWKFKKRLPPVDPFDNALLSIRSSSRPRLSRAFLRTRILWVDDYPEVNRPLAQILSDTGLRIDNAVGTSEAMAALRRGKFAAVISDMGRGENSTAGLELISQMRESSVQVPCLIYTSPRSEAEYAAAATERGATICTSGTVSLLRSLADVLRVG